MSKELTTQNKELEALEKVLIKGDLAGLNEQQRVAYVSKICKALKISPLFQPFDYIPFDGKIHIYAKRSCAEQLRQLRSISIKIVDRERLDGLYTVTAQARDKHGREDESIGSVDIKGLSGKFLANALMRAETKAKRRVTLSICGLGVLDELEAEDIVTKEAREVNQAVATQVEGQIEGTTSRPEFEAVDAQNLPPAETPQVLCYTLKAGKNKGKPITSISTKKLQEWLKWYSSQDVGSLHKDVQDDAFEIQVHLAEIKMYEENKNE